LFSLLLTALLLAVPWDAQGATSASEPHPVGGEAAGLADAHAGEHGAEHHALPLYAPKVFSVGGFPVTNSMLVTWVVALGLIVFAQVATRRMAAVPSGAQNFLEWLVEGLYGLLEGIMGPDLVRRSFWFFASIFILILGCNWAGLLPGFGSLGWHVTLADGREDWLPLLRGANADLNLTFAMAMIFFLCWFVWALQANGVKGFLLHIFGPKGDTTGFLRVILLVVFFLVGFIEVVSISFRPVSLAFRLYGNIYAGENMLESMLMLVPGLGWLIAIPFYFLELLVGLVQALVFMLLTAVFTLLICLHDEEGHGSGSH
jgi:F-type H+-transporting ATPase subunit a